MGYLVYSILDVEDCHELLQILYIYLNENDVPMFYEDIKNEVIDNIIRNIPQNLCWWKKCSIGFPESLIGNIFLGDGCKIHVDKISPKSSPARLHGASTTIIGKGVLCLEAGMGKLKMEILMMIQVSVQQQIKI